MDTPTPVTSNKPTLDTVLADADLFGALAAKSKDSQAQFAIKIFGAGYLGVIDNTLDKHGKGIDDAQVITARYVKARNAAVVFDAKAPNQRKTASCFRTMIKAALLSKFGSGEPLTAMNTLMNIRIKLRADPAVIKLLDDAFNTQMKFCRTLIKRDTLPSDQELRSMCLKTQHDTPTAEDVILGIRKRIANLEQGRHGPQLANEETGIITAACTKILTDMAKARGAHIASAVPAKPKKAKPAPVAAPATV